MYQPYLTQREFYSFYDVSRIISEDKFPGIRGAAALQVEQDMRARGNDPASLMVAISLVEADDYAQKTITATTTYDGITPYNANRLVVDITAITDEATFTLEGSRDDTTYRAIESSVDGKAVKIVTQSDSEYVDFFTSKYEYVRLKVVTSSSLTFTAFVIDATLDMLTMYKMIEIGAMPYAGNPEADELSAYAKAMYSQTIQSLTIDADVDGDGEIEDGEDNSVSQIIGYR